MPTKESALYNGALEVGKTTDFAFRTFRPDGSPSDVVRTKYVKAPYAEAVTAPAALQPGLKAVWHDFRGNLCADIDAAFSVITKSVCRIFHREAVKEGYPVPVIP